MNGVHDPFSDAFNLEGSFDCSIDPETIKNVITKNVTVFHADNITFENRETKEKASFTSNKRISRLITELESEQEATNPFDYNVLATYKSIIERMKELINV